MDIVTILILAGAAWVLIALLLCMAVAFTACKHTPAKDPR
jgi:hypothetical protein